jgi:hypothetical protein
MHDIAAASHRRAKRKNILVRILEALHASRRLEAHRMLRRYSHLIARPETSGIVPAPRQEEDHRNVHGHNSVIHLSGRARRHAATRSISDQHA